ncbi:organic cation transporter protein-like isoform X2 [Belonocnema kinseyi]|uniref:organic cation transporter protein-like isoform X2 n=1 Tax=Belonocnema kinseyi TaxID=2817044 RepID=UPI00143D9F02|nr:organic cation transporter protein-like isoform X2 [Belonocnema kinseyi]
MSVEDLKIGCFHVFVLIALSVNYVIVAMSHLLPVFYNYSPKFSCQELKNGTKGCVSPSLFKSISNFTSEFQIKDTKPTTCSSEYIFEIENGEQSVITEWSLVCEKEYLAFLGTAIYFLGVLMGAWIAGIMADRIGRLPVLAICLYTQGTMAVSLYVVQDYSVFLVLRGFQGVFVQGLETSTFILALELFPSKFRTIVGLIMQIAWAVGLALLAGLSYSIPDWRILQLAISVPTAVTVLYIWIIPESPRWLLAKGKSTEADIALEKIVKYNGCFIRLKTIKEPDTIVSENKTPVNKKPERKSRDLSLDLKSKKVEEILPEIEKLLAKPEPNPEIQKVADSENCKDEQVPEINSKPEVPLKVNNSNNKMDEKREEEKSLKLKKKRHSKSISRGEDSHNIQKGEETLELGVRNENKKQIGLNVSEKLKERVASEKKINRGLLQLAKYKSIIRHGAILIQIWFTSAAANHCVEFLLPNLNANRHITFALGGALEIASCILTYFVLSRHGRKLPLGIFEFFIGVICICHAFLDYFLPQPSIIWLGPLKKVMLLLTKMVVISSFFALHLLSAELFPTISRATCFGFCVVFAKIASIFMTFFLEIEKNYIPVSACLGVVGMLCLGSGIVALTLPETLNRILPDTMDEANNLGRKFENRNQSLEYIKNQESGKKREVLREKLFSDNWVDAGNGIIVNFNEGKDTNSTF